MSLALYNHAAKDLGLKETPGKGSTPRIRAAIKQSASWLDGDDSVTSWCGCIRGTWGIETGTGVPKEHYRAASWAKWGKAVPLEDTSKWQKGDTIVMGRSGGNHVTILDRVVGSRAYCLGGNQSNQVTIAPFAVSGIWAVRR
jgi:uncharacterized protein (TIGR02594 family)